MDLLGIIIGLILTFSFPYLWKVIKRAWGNLPNKRRYFTLGVSTMLPVYLLILAPMIFLTITVEFSPILLGALTAYAPVAACLFLFVQMKIHPWIYRLSFGEKW